MARSAVICPVSVGLLSLFLLVKVVLCGQHRGIQWLRKPCIRRRDGFHVSCIACSTAVLDLHVRIRPCAAELCTYV